MPCGIPADTRSVTTTTVLIGTVVGSASWLTIDQRSPTQWTAKQDGKAMAAISIQPI